MPDEESTDAQWETRLQEMQGQRDEARQDLVKCQGLLRAAAKAEQEAVRKAAAADAARHEADDARDKAASRANAAEVQAQKAQDDLASRLAAEAKLVKNARPGVQEFVLDSLTQVMSGVDLAAVHAETRRQKEMSAASAHIVASSLGALASNAETLVEFDLAVVADAAKVEELKKGVGLSAGVSFLEVFGVGVTASVESSSEARDSVSHHNRIRFSVPVTFASQASG